jgi:hypothetical protein
MIALLILAASLALSLAVALLTHGQVLLLFLPLAFGLPLAALFRGRGR